MAGVGLSDVLSPGAGALGTANLAIVASNTLTANLAQVRGNPNSV